MSNDLFDKYINGSLNAEEQIELEVLLQDENIQREFVEYTVETHAYVSMLKKQKSESKRKVKKQPKVLRFLILGAAAIIAVFFYLNLSKFRNFSMDGRYVSLNEKISVETKKTLTSKDGSSIIMMPGTELMFLSNDPVEIHLINGEIKAQIQPQSESFTILAGETRTKVLGTEFNLFKQGSQIDLFVEEGKVSFGTEKESLIFKEGEGGRVNEKGLARLDSKYKKWYDWSRSYAKRKDVYVYLNFNNEDELNNLAELSKGKIKFEKRYGSYSQGRWQEKLALENGGLESLANKALSLGQDFTIWSWTKLGDYQGIYPPIINADFPEWRLQYSKDGDFVHAGHNINIVDGRIPLPKEQWHFMAVTFTKELTKTYVNGKYDQSMPGEDSSLLPKSLKIGYYKQKGIFRVFKGLIGEIAIQKGALSEEQIREIYEATKP